MHSSEPALHLVTAVVIATVIVNVVTHRQLYYCLFTELTITNFTADKCVMACYLNVAPSHDKKSCLLLRNATIKLLLLFCIILQYTGWKVSAYHVYMDRKKMNVVSIKQLRLSRRSLFRDIEP